MKTRFARRGFNAPVWSLVAGLLMLLGCSEDTTMNVREVWAVIESPALVIDVRTAEEVQAGALIGAFHVPYEDILRGVEALGATQETPIVVYCRSGNRSGIAQSMLQQAGYSAVVNGGAYDDLAPMQSDTPVNQHWDQ
jgi:phage shock protein E